MTKKTDDESKKNLYCSFCGKSQHEVKKLIAGPSVFVCDECVDLCNEIILEEETGSTNDLKKQSLQELNKQLEQAVANEDYELAAQLRDEISKRN